MEAPTALLMFIAHRHAEARILAHLHDHGFDDLTVAQARIAARIGEHGTRLTDLAEQAQVTKQTAGFLVDQLERMGYVDRTPDPSDGRDRLVRISARGEQARAAARRAEQRIEAEWRAHLGERRYRGLRAALEALREVTDPYA